MQRLRRAGHADRGILRTSPRPSARASLRGATAAWSRGATRRRGRPRSARVGPAPARGADRVDAVRGPRSPACPVPRPRPVDPQDARDPRIPFIAALAACGLPCPPAVTTRSRRARPGLPHRDRAEHQRDDDTGTTSTSTPPTETTANTVPFAASDQAGPPSTSEDGLTGHSSTKRQRRRQRRVPTTVRPTSPWNTRVDAAAVDPRSDRFMRQAQSRFGVNEGRPRGADAVQRRPQRPVFINTERWTTPVVDADGGVADAGRLPPAGQPPGRQTIPTSGACGDGAFVKTLLIPPDDNPRPQYDGWFTVIDRRGTRLRPVARAPFAGRPVDLVPVPAYLGPQRLRLPRADRRVSARGSGLPFFGGADHPGGDSGRAHRPRAVDRHARPGLPPLRAAGLDHRRPRPVDVAP